MAYSAHFISHRVFPRSCSPAARDGMRGTCPDRMPHVLSLHSRDASSRYVLACRMNSIDFIALNARIACHERTAPLHSSISRLTVVPIFNYVSCIEILSPWDKTIRVSGSASPKCHLHTACLSTTMILFMLHHGHTPPAEGVLSALRWPRHRHEAIALAARTQPSMSMVCRSPYHHHLLSLKS